MAVDMFTGFPPIPLLANSYDLQDLEKATLHAESLKTEDGQRKAFDAIAVGKALNQEVLEDRDAPPAPEGTVLADVEDASGRTVKAPVAIPATEEEAEPEGEAVAAATSRRRGTAEITTTTATDAS